MGKKRTIKLILVGILCGAVITSAAGIGYLQLTGRRIVTAKAAEEYGYLKENYGFLDAMKQVIKEQYYLPVEDEQALTDGIYKGLVSGLGDPYSEYLTAEELEDMVKRVTGSYGGVGVTMSPNDEDQIEVVSVTDNSPAAKAGIRTGDRILGVDGVTYSGSQLSEAAELIRGEKGTKVTLTILRDDDLRTYELVREELTDTTVYPKTLDGNIGYLRITSFETNTGKDFAKELEKMENAGVDGVIIDIRNNGGGIVDSAIEVADQLMDAATVVYAENRQGERTYYKTEDGKTDLPYVLLVNGGTASAAEILAAGVKEDGGLVVGSQTYGKGIIQTTQALINGGALKMTTMQYYTPSGQVIHKVGMTPNVVVELSWDDVDENGALQDRQLEKAVELFEKAE